MNIEINSKALKNQIIDADGLLFCFESIDENTYSEIALTITKTEQEFTSKRRLEQGYLRKKLFKN